MPHQKEAIYQASFKRDLFLAWEMGTGKSCAIINILRRLYTDTDGVQNTLILAPLIVLHNWKKEFDMYSQIPQNAIVILQGPIAKRIEYINNIKGPRILVCNYDAMQNQDFQKAILRFNPKILICDESHVLKDYKSKRAKAVAAIADRCEHRYLLSGTPILNNALDLFMQFRILDGHLDKDSTFGLNFFIFRGRYFEDHNAHFARRPGYFPKYVPRPETYELLNKKIYSKTLRVKKKDVLLNLPPLVEETRFVELSEEQAKLYKEMKRDFVTFIEEIKDKPRAVVAKLALTKALRLHQIATGFVKTEDGSIYEIKANPRLEALKELLLELTPEHKVIVWSVFKENYRVIAKLCESIGVKYVELHGGTISADKFKNAERFNTEPEIKVLIGNPGAGGIGINLTASDYTIYYSRGFRLADDLQSEARNHRRGSEIHSRITRINISAPGTIDELISEALSKKINISDLIIDRFKEI